MPETIARRGALIALVVAVLASALGALYAISGPPATRREGLFLLFLGGAILASSRAVRFSSLRIDVVPFHPFVLISFALFGTRSAVLIAAVSVITAASFRNELPPVLRVVFNLGATTLATVIAGNVFQALGGRMEAGVGELLLPLSASAAVFFVVKTVLVAAAISLELGQRWGETWNRSLRWTAPNDLAGIPIALATLAVLPFSPVAAILVALAPCGLLWIHYRIRASRSISQGDVSL